MEIQQHQPPSSTSSPSHDFSFTISFNSSSPPNFDTTKTHHASSAVDLTPADDIFFHGHLLPLHVISNLPLSPPRSSANSIDSFTLPIRELLESKSKHHSFNSYEYRRSHHDDPDPAKNRVKSKSFSLFGLPRRRKEEDPSSEKQKKKMKFDVGHFVKKYMRMFSKGRKEEPHFRSKQPYSFSGKVDSKEERMNLKGRRREVSAPASIRTSPTNSGVLKAGATPQSSSDSTMEELQAAIQAAIAHCKNSIATQDQVKI